MSSLGPHARRLLELGKDAGEPDDAALARSRAALLRRVGGGAAVAAAITTVATTAKAAAPVAAAPLAAAPVAAAPIAASAPLVATSLLAPSLAIKVAATLALVVGVGAATASYQADPPRARSSATAAVAPPSPATSKPPESREVPRSSAPADTIPPPAVSAMTSPPPLVEEAAPLAPAVPPAPKTPVAASAPANPIVIPTPAPSLSRDVESLREAQAALVNGDPKGAREAAERVQPEGPLSDEREGLVVLAGCAMHAPDAREQAAKFVERRPQAPLAVRVRAACGLGN